MTTRGAKKALRSRGGTTTLLSARAARLSLVGCLLSGVLVAASVWDVFAPKAGNRPEVVVRLRTGEPFSVVAEQLVNGGLGYSQWNLKLWAWVLGAERRMRPGEYLLRTPLSAWSALQEIQSGTAGYRVFTIPEGSTVEDIAALYEAAGFGSADEFLRAARDPNLLSELQMPPTGLEGYLFPDTYHFVWADPPERMIRTMVHEFRARTAMLASDRARLGWSEHEMVTLASIIEKEAKWAHERPLISAVFHNRLQRGMRLQADPTAVYGLGRNVRPMPEHLRLKTAHNTYQKEGLPPGPICNPGYAAMEAAVRPAPVDYLYFVARGDGSHSFSRTLEEHNLRVRESQERKAGATDLERLTTQAAKPSRTTKGKTRTEKKARARKTVRGS